MTNDNRVEKRQATLKATTTLLRYWNGAEVNIGDPLPADLADAAAVLQNVPAVDLLRLVACNRPTLSALLR